MEKLFFGISEEEKDNWGATQLRYASFAAHYGLKPSKAEPCFHRVAGRPCPYSRSRYMDGCPMVRWHMRMSGPWSVLWDHVNIWRDEAGRYVVTTEPYYVSGKALVDLYEMADRVGLSVRFSRYSPHCPGGTSMIMLQPAQRGVLVDYLPPAFAEWLAEQQHRQDRVGALVKDLETPWWYPKWRFHACSLHRLHSYITRRGMGITPCELDHAVAEWRRSAEPPRRIPFGRVSHECGTSDTSRKG